MINLTPTEQARLSEVARQTVLAPEAYAERLVRAHLPHTVSSENEWYAKPRHGQESDGTPLMPDLSAAGIFARWDAEAARMTPEEREEEDRSRRELEVALLPRTQM